jgi:hypothetical protein
MNERPIRVWLYRDWCWICRRCSTAGWGHSSQQSALYEALTHCRGRVTS